MDRLEKIKTLAEEVVILLKEFREEASILGEKPVKNICLDESNDIIITSLSEEVVEYSLSEISYIFSDGIDGFKKYEKNLDESLELITREANYQYSKMGKKEFSENIGKMIFAQYRCNEIYKRIVEIEKETIKL